MKTTMIIASLVWGTLFFNGSSLADTEVANLKKLLSIQQAKLEQLEQRMTPIGTIIAFHKNLPGVSLPSGSWVPCSGQKIADSSSPLFGVSLPNLNGERRFLRGTNDATGVFEDDAFRKHRHVVNGGRHPVVSDKGESQLQQVQMFHQGPASQIDIFRVAVGGNGHGVHGNIWGAAHEHNVEESGSDETRPRNMAVTWMIRIK